MSVASHPKRIVGLIVIAGALLMLAAAAGVHVEIVPSFGVRREILAITLALVAAIDGVTGLVFVIKS